VSPDHERAGGPGGSSQPGGAGEPAFQFKDRRRIDPQSGTARAGGGVPQPGSASANPGDPANAGQPITATITAASAELAAAKQEAAERTADLQRITAEYANYRKRTDRDRAQATVAGKAAVIGELLSVLDDLDRAEQHGDLSGPFKAVADRLVDTLTRQGLAGYGAEGDAFDPTVHEAVQFSASDGVDHPMVATVFRRGYTLSDRVLRPAVVVVVGPEHDARPPEAASSGGAPGGAPGAASGSPDGSTDDTDDTDDTSE
jgi:molecular chaperone GrpE